MLLTSHLNPSCRFFSLLIWCQLFLKKSLVRATRGRELILRVHYEAEDFTFYR